MQLCQAIRLCSEPHSSSLAIVGSGGKTTALFQLAHSLTDDNCQPNVALQDRAVIVAATSHLKVDQIHNADSHWIISSPEDMDNPRPNIQGIMLCTGPMDGDRTIGLDFRSVMRLHEISKHLSIPLLIEADGSRQHPLKAPAEHEPPIPQFVDAVLVVAGMSALGKPLGHDFVHRPEVFSRLSGLDLGDQITSSAIQRVLCHSEGGLKNIPGHARKLVLLNQADSPQYQSIAGKMAASLLEYYDAVIVGSLQSADLHSFESTAAILLAAGQAKRYGQSKQLLDYHGQTFIRTVAQKALAGALHPVIVVTGANARAVEASILDLPVTLVHNPDWESGQSSSIRVGLQALASKTTIQHQNALKNFPLPSSFIPDWSSVGSALFLLVDQPQVPVALLKALMDQHSSTLAPVLAPLVNDRRANPVLFDRKTFPELFSLKGDVGGRAIFGKFPPTYLPWHDESLLLDVDTPDDFRKLQEMET